MEIYTKICLHCVYREDFDNTIKFLHRNGMIEEIKRTTYLPELHQEATNLYGSENYIAFVMHNGKVLDWEQLATMVRDGKELHEIFIDDAPETKPNITKSKPVRKGKAKRK